ncbi:MAG: exonuclease SbcCD subunit D C-terminal domain-containing protein [Saprospiraceae bacterium]|nr:exonuclease SbcCD subunit D C-terminal domain-containing protein [Saprospiraceae bacterium]
MVVRVELSENRVEVHPVPIPKFRELLRLKGKLDEITTQLNQYKNPYPLKTLVEVEVIDKAFDATIIHEAQSLESIQSEVYQVIKTRISFLDQRQGNDSRTEMDDHIENLDPWQIFDIRMETEQMEAQSREALKIAYLHILESLNE